MSSGAVALTGTTDFLSDESRLVWPSPSGASNRFLFDPWEMVPKETRRDPLLFVRFLKEEELPRLRQVLPRIQSEVLPILVELMRLGPNWDSYRARPVKKEPLEAAIHLLTKLLDEDTVMPSIVPANDGGVQLEWHALGKSIEIEISPSDSAFVYIAVDGAEQEWEGTLNDVDFRSLGKVLPREGQP
jgi:hypothetical protein